MFYYPPNSCCFVLWGSFAKEVRLAGQRHKAQVPAGSGLLAPPARLPPDPHPPHSTRLGAQGRAATVGHGPGKCTCCFMIFISRAIVGAVSRSLWGGGMGALLNGHRRGAVSCGTRRAGCEARRCVSSSGWQGRGAGARAGSHHVPRERKPGHSTASRSQRKPSARGGGIAGAQRHRAGLQDEDASPVWRRPGAAAAPSTALNLSPPLRVGWGSLGITRGWGPRGEREHRQGQATTGISALAPHTPLLPSPSLVPPLPIPVGTVCSPGPRLVPAPGRGCRRPLPPAPAPRRGRPESSRQLQPSMK